MIIKPNWTQFLRKMFKNTPNNQLVSIGNDVMVSISRTGTSRLVQLRQAGYVVNVAESTQGIQIVSNVPTSQSAEQAAVHADMMRSAVKISAIMKKV